jgi:hypothetical protein
MWGFITGGNGSIGTGKVGMGPYSRRFTKTGFCKSVVPVVVRENSFNKN